MARHMLGIHRGASRLVIVCGPVAVKFPRGESGVRCNQAEGVNWQRSRNHPVRGQRLCPVLWHDPKGRVLIMRAARPLPADVHPADVIDRDWWDYLGGEDLECPCEHKPADWGMLDGVMVCVDYAASAST
jgi:hypothetical protein